MRAAIAATIIVTAGVVMGLLRAPHARRGRSVSVVRSDETLAETALVGLAWTGFLLPAVWVISPVLAFANYPARLAMIVTGSACLALGLWVFHRAHADLGTNWSITVELKQNHRLVTRGIYERVRHPMYLSLFLYSVGQAVVVPNWIAGPSYFVTFGVLYLCRVRVEESMMIDAFGDEYRGYIARTNRLIPRARIEGE
ncbi:MAG: protein-S-isoprenylcysteine O-methyltransferase [Vicinamibacterales bacterium]